MGLLSDPQKRKKLTELLLKWRRTLSITGYIGGVVWLLMLASDQFNVRVNTYGHALLPGMVETRYAEDHLASDYYHKFSKICTRDVESQKKWLQDQFISAGIEVFQQNFSCSNGKTKGQNTYGILRSPRASGVESMVLHVPLRPNCKSNGAIALMLSMVTYFKQLSVWAKDIVFLVTESEPCGIAAWLEEYHGENASGITSSGLNGRAGHIQAALVIDFPHDSVSGIDVHPEALNGRLPNLDFVHMNFVIARAENIAIKLHTQDSFFGYVDKVEDYLRCLKTLAKMMLLHATGYSTGSHGLYLKYRIEAISLKAAEESSYHYRSHFFELGRLVEAVFRSFNNLLSHVHEGYFLYLLPASNRQASIPLYMPALGGILLGPLLYAVTLWMDVFAEDVPSSDKHKSSHKALSTLSWVLPLCLITSHVSGALLFWSLTYLVQDKFVHQSDGYIATGLLATSCTIVLTLWITKPLRSTHDWKLLKLFNVIYLTLIVVTAAMLNFSFGFILALTCVPANLIIHMDTSWLKRAFNFMMVILCSPISLFILLVGLHSLISSNNNLDLVELMVQTILKADTMVKYAFADDHQDVWTSSIISFVIFPIWLNLAILSSPLST